MTNLRIRSIRNGVAHDPSRIMDETLDGVPETWRQTMQFSRPIDGLNICCMHGRPGANWSFQAEGGPNLTLYLAQTGGQ